MRFFKFLDANGLTPHTGTRWRPGEWVEAPSARPCYEGLHACRAHDLAWWIGSHLWEIELDGDVVEARHKVVARRARLLEPVTGYGEAVTELGAVTTWRARDRAVRALREAGHEDEATMFEGAATIDELASCRGVIGDNTFAGLLAAFACDAAAFVGSDDVQEAPFIGCCSAGQWSAGVGGSQADFDRGYREEREFQSAWLADRLALV